MEFHQDKDSSETGVRDSNCHTQSDIVHLLDTLPKNGQCFWGGGRRIGFLLPLIMEYYGTEGNIFPSKFQLGINLLPKDL